MKIISFRHLVVGVLMLAAAGMALALKPTIRMEDSEVKFDLETLIPKQFGDWKIDQTIKPLIPDPQQEALIHKIYNQTLARTYVNSRDERVMLSIAYGGEQSDDMAVHKPEVCYPSQGFQILKNVTGMFSTGVGDIPVRRLVATQGQRVEPITYWTTVGDTVAVNKLQWKLNQLKYGLTGKIPDGLLFRISSIEADDVAAYRMQDNFARALLAAMTPQGKERIIGHLAPPLEKPN